MIVGAAISTVFGRQLAKAIGKDGKEITINSLIDKIIPLGMKFLLGTGPDKMKNLMEDIMADIMPDAIKLLEAVAPEKITSTVNTILSKPKVSSRC